MIDKACKTCGATLHGEYCHVCGEKWITDRDKSLSSWLQETFTNLIQLDGKVIRTLISLLLRPGQLAKHYFEGRRKPYLRMVNLFLIANLLYFLLPSFDIFKSNLYIQTNRQFYSELATRMVEDKLTESKMELEEFGALYDAKTSDVSKLILIILAPIFGCFIYFLYAKRIFLTDGFNLALQLWSAFILFCIIPLSLIAMVISKVQPDSMLFNFLASDATLSSVMVVLLAIYLWYLLDWLKEKRLLKIAKLIVLLFCLPPVFVCYRFLLFVLTLWSI